ncbi:MAG: 4-hydroxy-tetrahydrodipicolinate synthase [Salinivirgaceae bacterium]|nr:4-hydroxy-tetrahydrodipicolinate synthase [Salinivirgaceae bacterium]
MIQKLRGVGVALVTPFNTDGTIDYDALANLIELQINGGTSYIVALGTTGEPATLSKAEKSEVLEFILQKVAGRIPVVVGCGGNNTAELIAQAKEYENDSRIAALLSVAPFYNKPNQNGVYAHFKALADNVNKPILLYNVPGRTGINISVDVVVRLASECKNIIGIKEASGNVAQCMQLASRCPKDFILISGDDALTLPLIACGFSGVISVLQNAYPVQFSHIVGLTLDGRFAEARAEHYKFLSVIDTLFAEGSPSGVKAYLELQGKAKNVVRLPLATVSDTLYAKIKTLNSTVK